MHVDEKTGRRYSHNGDTGVTKWLTGENEKSERGGMNETQTKTSTSIHKDAKTGRRYSYSETTGQTQWLSNDDEEDEAIIEEHGESKQPQQEKTIVSKACE